MRDNIDAHLPLMAAAVAAGVICIPSLGPWGLVGVLLAIYVSVRLMG